MRRAIWRGDLARVLVERPSEEVTRAAGLLGFEPIVIRETPAAVDVATEVVEMPAVAAAPSRPAAESSVPFWRLEEMHFSEPPKETKREVLVEEELSAADMGGGTYSLFDVPAAPPLAPWSRLWPVLRECLSSEVRSHEPDVPALLRTIGRGRVIERVPHLVRRAWATRAEVLVDRSARLVPFWSDQDEVLRGLERAIGKSAISRRWLDPASMSRALVRKSDFTAGMRPDAKVPVLALSDLGTYGTQADRRAWVRTARRLAHHGVSIAALLPVPPSRWPRPAAWRAACWETGRSSRLGTGAGDSSSWAARAERLLCLASHAAYVQPGLLRALRRLLPRGQADAATEAEAWKHAAVRAAGPGGFVLHAKRAAELRKAFAAAPEEEIPSTVKRRVAETIAFFHDHSPPELRHAETLSWLSRMPVEIAPPGEPARAIAFARHLVASSWSEMGRGEARRFSRILLEALDSSAYRHAGVGPMLVELWAAAYQGLSTVAPLDIAPESIGEIYARRAPERSERWWGIRQIGAELVIHAMSSGKWPSDDRGPGSPVAWMLAASVEAWMVGDAKSKICLEDGLVLPIAPERAIEIRTDRCTIRLAQWTREKEWAVAAGRDRFGLFADARIAGVIQRFRYIPPGRFRMGSPDSESGRCDDEGPVHTVTWTRGFWLADTPVTQELWAAVMGKNPSQFKTPERPVETINWDDCTVFVAEINRQNVAVKAGRPTEAEWEYACRAGTETATWKGDLNFQPDGPVSILNEIAWHGRNTETETESVALKEPNPWGLYDMLGNVLEWCEDASMSYEGRDFIDPPARDRARPYRVIRGGSWASAAGLVRAAYRFAAWPGSRSDILGFRLARGQAPKSGASPEAGARSVPARRGAGRKRK